MVSAVLLVLISAIGLLFFPSHVEIKRTDLIFRSRSDVFSYLNDLGNFNAWSPWYRKDTAAVYRMEGPASGTGAKLFWESDNSEVGNGSLTIKRTVADSIIQLELGFRENGTAQSEFRLATSGEATEVTWVLSIETGYNPFLRLLSAFMEKKVGHDFDEGLDRMKSNLEQSAPRSNAVLLVEKVQLPLTYYLAIRDKAVATDIAAVLERDFSRIMAEMKKQGLSLAGAPFVIYHSPGPEFELEVAMPVGTPGQTSGDIKAGTMNAGRALIARYFGPYDKTEKAHAAIDEYVKANQLTVTGAPWESYVTDPGLEKDTAKWETDVYYPIR